jgi:hypothetical protein
MYVHFIYKNENIRYNRRCNNDNDKSRRMRYGTAQISAVTAMAEGPNK